MESVAVEQQNGQKADGSVTFGKSWARVYVYTSHRIPYFKYMWGRGDAVLGQRHIPGGRCCSALAQERKAQVEEWMRAHEPKTVAMLIDYHWRSRRSGSWP